MYAFYQKNSGLQPISDMAMEAALDHAKAEFPKESVGVVYGDEYIRLKNVNVNPELDFTPDPMRYAELYVERGKPHAVIHSHPKGEHYPSKLDQQSQINTQVTYGLIVMGGPNVIKNVLFWGDDVPLAPAIGRPFVYGIYDCWATARDAYYRDFGVRLKNYARNDELLNPAAPDNYFMDYWPDAGFVPIDFDELKRGDVVLSRIFRNDKVNHCGYYLGDGTVLHHPFGTPEAPMLSRRDLIYRWRKLITHCFRHSTHSDVAVQAPAQGGWI